MRCLHSGSLSESGCLRKMGGKFQYMSPRNAAPSQMETYWDSPRFQWSPALNPETLWFHKRAAHVGSRSNSPPSSGAKRDLLHAQYPYKTRSSPPSDYKPQYWYWLVLVLHPLFWRSGFHRYFLSHVMLQQPPPPWGALCHVGDMAAFQEEPIQLRLPFPGPNRWTTTPVFHRSLQREKQPIASWFWHKSQCREHQQWRVREDDSSAY